MRHDVPEVLRSGRALSDNSWEGQPGFRIQIVSTLNKAEADQAVEDAIGWWRKRVREDSFQALYQQREEDPPVYQDFRAPYYRIRIGNFPTREDAQLLLDVIQRSYQSAFIAPDQVILK